MHGQREFIGIQSCFPRPQRRSEPEKTGANHRNMAIAVFGADLEYDPAFMGDLLRREVKRAAGSHQMKNRIGFDFGNHMQTGKRPAGGLLP